VLSDNAHGSIAGAQVFPESMAAAIAHSPGVTSAAPMAIVLQQTLRAGGRTENVEVFGVQPGSLGAPAVTSGQGLSGTGQLVVNSNAKAPTGTRVEVGAMSFRVTGQVTDRTMLAGVPVI